MLRTTIFIQSDWLKFTAAMLFSIVVINAIYSIYISGQIADEQISKPNYGYLAYRKLLDVIPAVASLGFFKLFRFFKYDWSYALTSYLLALVSTFLFSNLLLIGSNDTHYSYEGVYYIKDGSITFAGYANMSLEASFNFMSVIIAAVIFLHFIKFFSPKAKS